jgi:hypothetical protein
VLFAELENMPRRRRREDPEILAKECALHEMLGLWREWRCSVCSVLDREPRPCWPPSMPAHHDWHKVRAVRLALLEAVGASSVLLKMKEMIPVCRDLAADDA